MTIMDVGGKNITRGQLEKMAEGYEKLKTQLSNVKEKSQEAVGIIVRTLETGAVAFGFGLAKGRWGKISVAGIPADLGAGVLGHLLGFMGVGGKNAEHLHALSDGALASYAVEMGAKVGDDMRKKSGDNRAPYSPLSPLTRSGDEAGALPQGRPDLPSVDQMAAMAAQRMTQPG